MDISGIYQIQSKTKPERKYIGSAINIHKRWGYHLLKLRYNKHENNKLQRHFNKYGKSDFQFSILLSCDKEDLIKIEQYFIDSYDPFFNICKVAGSPMKNRNHSLQSCKKISEKRKGIKFSEEHKNNMKIAWLRRKLIPVSEETKQKMRKSQKYRCQNISKEAKINMCKHMAGNKYRLGKLGGKKVIDILTGEIFNSIGVAAKSINMKYRTLHAQLKGEYSNKTNLKLMA